MDVKIGTGKVRATIQLQGAMTTAVFEAGTDAEFSPSYTATWEGFPEAPILDRLRGDFACLPFGAAPEAADDLPRRVARRLHRPLRVDPRPILEPRMDARRGRR